MTLDIVIDDTHAVERYDTILFVVHEILLIKTERYIICLLTGDDSQTMHLICSESLPDGLARRCLFPETFYARCVESVSCPLMHHLIKLFRGVAVCPRLTQPVEFGMITVHALHPEYKEQSKDQIEDPEYSSDDQQGPKEDPCDHESQPDPEQRSE